MPNHRRFISRESLKLIWMRAEDDVMKIVSTVIGVKNVISFIRLCLNVRKKVF